MQEPSCENTSFEQALAELEKIVRDLEDGQTGLEDSLKRYEQGIGLLRRCYAQLRAAEQRILVLTGEDGDGRPITFGAAWPVSRRLGAFCQNNGICTSLGSSSPASIVARRFEWVRAAAQRTYFSCASFHASGGRTYEELNFRPPCARHLRRRCNARWLWRRKRLARQHVRTIRGVIDQRSDDGRSDRVLAEKRRANVLFGGENFIGNVPVFRQLPDEQQNQRHICFARSANRHRRAGANMLFARGGLLSSHGSDCRR